MEWIHKKIKITIGADGKFHFRIKNSDYKRNSLEDAKSCIDDELSEYYTVDSRFISSLLRKLDSREQDFVKNLIRELRRHDGNAYCELGITEGFEFNCRFDKLVDENVNIF